MCIYYYGMCIYYYGILSQPREDSSGSAAPQQESFAGCCPVCPSDSRGHRRDPPGNAIPGELLQLWILICFFIPFSRSLPAIPGAVPESRDALGWEVAPSPSLGSGVVLPQGRDPKMEMECGSNKNNSGVGEGGAALHWDFPSGGSGM